MSTRTRTATLLHLFPERLVQVIVVPLGEVGWERPIVPQRPDQLFQKDSRLAPSTSCYLST